MTPAERTTVWARDVQKMATENVNSFGARLCTWLLLGNSGALVLTFQALTSGSSCDKSMLAWSAKCFIAGAVAAFAAGTTSYFLGLIGLRTLSKSADLLDNIAINEYYITKLEAENVDVDENSQLQINLVEAVEKLRDLERRAKRIWIGFWCSIVIYAVSAGSFATGVLSPFNWEQAGVSSCARGPQRT